MLYDTHGPGNRNGSYQGEAKCIPNRSQYSDWVSTWPTDTAVREKVFGPAGSLWRTVVFTRVTRVTLPCLSERRRKKKNRLTNCMHHTKWEIILLQPNLANYITTDITKLMYVV